MDLRSGAFGESLSGMFSLHSPKRAFAGDNNEI